MRSAFAVVFATAIFITVSFAQSKTGTAAAGKSIYATNCTTCHGADGKGNSTGRAMGVKDLNAPEAVRMTDAQIKRTITNGKGNMPPWKSQLSEAQIADVTAFIRSMQKGPKK
jgi:cbb3-type cytochrome c oxidase subunit III